MRFCFFVLGTLLALASGARAADPVPPPAPRERVKLLVLDLKGNDVDDSTVKTIQGTVTARLSEYSALEVVSGDDLRNLVQLEAERQQAGSCSDASCMAEIADALGAELVVFGSVGALEQSTVLNLNLFDSKSAVGLGRIVVQVESVDQMPRRLRPKLHDLLGRYYEKNNMTLPALPPEDPEPGVAAAAFDPGPWPWVAAGTGGVLIAAGVLGAVVGYLPLATFNQRRSDVLALEAQFKDDGKVSRIETARKAQAEMLDARDAWNSWGVILFDGGIAAACTGALLLGGGLVVGMVAAPSEDEGATAASAAGGGA